MDKETFRELVQQLATQCPGQIAEVRELQVGLEPFDKELARLFGENLASIEAVLEHVRGKTERR